jgi:hypothetical protein
LHNGHLDRQRRIINDCQRISLSYCSIQKLGPGGTKHPPLDKNGPDPIELLSGYLHASLQWTPQIAGATL